VIVVSSSPKTETLFHHLSYSFTSGADMSASSSKTAGQELDDQA